MNNNNLSINNTANSSAIELSTPASISYMWNWGSLLGISLIVQLMTGILLASSYNSDINSAFEEVINITRNIGFGYMVRFVHINTASIFFICIFIHIGRSLFNSSFSLENTWLTGCIITFMLMGTAFLGYVLPWGQISFWGATVITNLLSAIPYLGTSIVEWLWGGFSIDKATLNRFFSLHFLIPSLLSAIIIIHLAILHNSGSNNPIGTNNNSDMIIFHPFFSSNDLPTFILLAIATLFISLVVPFIIGDPENFNPANPLVTPIHIQPEWYFLFAYAILRSIPNNLGGVVGLISSIAALTLLPIINNMNTSNNWIPNNNYVFTIFIVNFVLLTWAGAIPVENPFENSSNVLSLIYFPILLSLCF